MILKLVSVLTFVQLFVLTSESQTVESWIEKNEKLPVEKIYLHTDREYYFTGETIWIKSYLTDSRSGRLIPGAENIYLHLIDRSGKVVSEVKILSVNGLASNQMEIPDTIRPGNYLLQATTNYLLNFSADACYSRYLTISEPPRSARAIESHNRTQAKSRMVADVSFLPEGGKLLEGISNLVAFKAIDANGYGVEASGLVRDNSGNEVVTFKTDYNGMGLFFMTPESGKTYRAVIHGFPTFQFRFDSLIIPEGVKIQLVNQTSRELLVNVCGNPKKFTGEPFYLVNMHRGQSVFYQPFNMEEENHLLKFESDMLKSGINQLVLLDKNLEPVSELLVFSSDIDLINLDVKTNRNVFENRSEVKLDISGSEKTEILNLSASVVHEAGFPNGESTQNILSAMLIDSELNGFVENPAGFFNDNKISAKTKQRLLMLTNGWSSYFWNQSPAASTRVTHKQKAGLDLHGIAKESQSGQPLKNGEITLVIEKKPEIAFLTQTTDPEGYFTFSGLLFNDTANVIIQAKNEHGKQNTVLEILPHFEIPLPALKIKALGAEPIFATNMEKQKYDHHLELNSYLRKKGIPVDKNKTETEAEITTDHRFRIYEKADQVIEIPDTEVSFGNILDFLTGKVPGLDISENSVSIRGTSKIDGISTPLFLIDGMPLSSSRLPGLPEEVGLNAGGELTIGETSVIDKIKSLPLRDIEKVEILKSPQNLAIFGTEGANGVIAVYSRKGKSDNSSALVKGLIEQKIAGFSSFKTFYSPKYLPENKQDEAPVFRPALFWEPEIIPENGNAEFSFFTSDETGKYKVIVEGISETGKICIGTGEFEVVETTGN